MDNGPESNAFVVGWPIDHSRSPLIHNYWIKQNGLRGTYQKHACEPENFALFLSQLGENGFVGGNITIPHKETAFDLVDECDSHARALGAVNTVWLHNGKLHGSNTDGYGFVANLDETAAGWSNAGRRQAGALVLGAGGAARAIVHALVERGFERIWIANRTPGRAGILARQFGSKCEPISLQEIADIAGQVRFVVNTTSVGMAGNNDRPVDVSLFCEGTIVNDIVYTPLITPLLKDATERGLQTADGLGMLLHQAVPGFERWFGVRPSVTPELRRLVLDDLGE